MMFSPLIYLLTSGNSLKTLWIFFGVIALRSAGLFSAFSVLSGDVIWITGNGKRQVLWFISCVLQRVAVRLGKGWI